jgi:hypothetical protein
MNQTKIFKDVEKTSVWKCPFQKFLCLCAYMNQPKSQFILILHNELSYYSHVPSKLGCGLSYSTNNPVSPQSERKETFPFELKDSPNSPFEFKTHEIEFKSETTPSITHSMSRKLHVYSTFSLQNRNLFDFR